MISGGQTGADQAGLAAAERFKIETGGHAPKGWITKDGPNPTLLRERYGLVESEGDYKVRTWENVKNSDATIRLCYSFTTPGEKCTYNGILKYNKLFKDIYLNSPDPADHVVEWIISNGIEILNVAGNTNGTLNKDIFKPVYDYLCIVFKRLKDAT